MAKTLHGGAGKPFGGLLPFRAGGGPLMKSDDIMGQASWLTDFVQLQVPGHLSGGGAGPQAAHDRDEVTGLDLAFVLLVIEGKAFLELWSGKRKKLFHPSLRGTALLCFPHS